MRAARTSQDRHEPSSSMHITRGRKAESKSSVAREWLQRVVRVAAQERIRLARDCREVPRREWLVSPLCPSASVQCHCAESSLTRSHMDPSGFHDPCTVHELGQPSLCVSVEPEPAIVSRLLYGNLTTTAKAKQAAGSRSTSPGDSGSRWYSATLSITTNHCQSVFLCCHLC